MPREGRAVTAEKRDPSHAWESIHSKNDKTLLSLVELKGGDHKFTAAALSPMPAEVPKFVLALEN